MDGGDIFFSGWKFSSFSSSGCPEVLCQFLMETWGVSSDHPTVQLGVLRGALHDDQEFIIGRSPTMADKGILQVHKSTSSKGQMKSKKH